MQRWRRAVFHAAAACEHLAPCRKLCETWAFFFFFFQGSQSSWVDQLWTALVITHECAFHAEHTEVRRSASPATLTGIHFDFIPLSACISYECGIYSCDYTKNKACIYWSWFGSTRCKLINARQAGIIQDSHQIICLVVFFFFQRHLQA